MRSFGPRRKAGIFVLLISILSFADASSVASGSRSVNLAPGRVSLLTEAERILGNVKSARYQHVTYVDEADGIYNFDCSGFVDYSLQQVLPESLSVVRFSPNSFDRQRAKDYYHHFANLGSGENPGGWYRVEKPAELSPGDVIAWLRSPWSDSDGTGHVMIVKSYPTIVKNHTNELGIAIIDSTRSPHADDSRTKGTTGVGTGTISIVTNTDGNAIGFRWRDGKSTFVRFTKIAFGQVGELIAASQIDVASHSITNQYGSRSYRGVTYVVNQVLILVIGVSLVGAIGVLFLALKRKERHTS